MSTFRYLDAATVEAIGLPPDMARAAVIAAFRAHAAAAAVSKPKLTVPVGPGHAFMSMCSAWEEEGLAANKWLGMANVAPGSGLPSIHSVILLNDYATGQLRAILDGDMLTGLRTAAMSAAAASFMARPDSRSIGFIGCGLQARWHLAAFRALFPELAVLHAFSRTRRSADGLLAGAAAAGLAGTVHDDAETVVRSSDLVITTVPMQDGLAPFLDPAWIRSGAFVSSVDVGRPWMPAGLRGLDVLAVDDHAQQDQSPPIAPGLGPAGTFDADLSELASGQKPGRIAAADRTMFIFRGVALADLAVAAKVYDAAVERGLGLVLAR